MAGIIAVSLAVLCYSLVSERFKDSMLTPPMIFAFFGMVIGAGGFGLLHVDLSNHGIHLLAEITLILVLFSDAARIDLRLLLKDHNLPLRMLIIGLPLTIALGTAIAMMMPFGFTWVEAALLASVLAPTDAALGQSVISNSRVPVRIRQTLNAESGLNDGLAVPFVFCLAMMMPGHGEGTNGLDHAGFAAKQILLGPLVGIIVGWLSGRLMETSAEKGWMVEAFEGPAVLAAAGLAYGLATAIGGNGFIAAFSAGLLFGFAVMRRCKFILEFAESEGQLLTLLSFLVFGAVMLPMHIDQITWPMFFYALLSLTIIRMVPIALSLLGTGVSLPTTLFLGWFGPRGLASILFGLIVLDEIGTPQASTILTITVLTVSLSILAHGLTAAPLAQRFGDIADEQGECPENEPVSEMATRGGFVDRI